MIFIFLGTFFIWVTETLPCKFTYTTTRLIGVQDLIAQPKYKISQTLMMLKMNIIVWVQNIHAYWMWLVQLEVSGDAVFDSTYILYYFNEYKCLLVFFKISKENLQLHLEHCDAGMWTFHEQCVSMCGKRLVARTRVCSISVSIFVCGHAIKILHWYNIIRFNNFSSAFFWW